MKTGNLELRAQSAPGAAGVELLFRQGNTMGVDVIMEEVEPGAVIDKPALRLGLMEAQTLMDDLWQSGLRPTEGTGSAGSLRATEKHLEDMRKLVFRDEEV